MSTPLIEQVIFACDAGMGSSAMGASMLRKKIKEAGITDVTVVNKAVADLPSHAQLVITQDRLVDRAKHTAPDAVHFSVSNFMMTPVYDEVIALLKEQRQ